MRPIPSLETQLDAYEALSSDDRMTRRHRHRRWALYATAAGSGLALTTSAEAGIIYSGIQDLTIAPAGNTSVSVKTVGINIDGKGHSFVGVASRGTGTFSGAPFRFGFAGLGNGFNSKMQMMLNGSSQLLRLASGAKISSHAGQFGTGTGFRVGSAALRFKSTSPFGPSQGGTWSGAHKGFAGVEFTQGGQEHFGWIRLSWNGDNGFPTSLTVVDWAYETDPGVAIAAGAVPEPSTGVLAMLAAGSAGVLAWRRRERPGVAGAQADGETRD